MFSSDGNVELLQDEFQKCHYHVLGQKLELEWEILLAQMLGPVWDMELDPVWDMGLDPLWALNENILGL